MKPRIITNWIIRFVKDYEKCVKAYDKMFETRVPRWVVEHRKRLADFSDRAEGRILSNDDIIEINEALNGRR